MIKETESGMAYLMALVGVLYAAYPPLMMLSVFLGSILFAGMTVRGKDYAWHRVFTYIAACGVLSVPLFLPMVDGFYQGGLSEKALGAITIIVTVVTVRFIPSVFSVIDDVLPNLLPKIMAKFTGVKND